MADEYLKAVAELEGDMREQIEEIGEEAVRTGKKAKKAFDGIDKDAKKTARSVGSEFRELGGKLRAAFAIVTAATAGAGLGMSRAAADAEELESKFDALFGESADAARVWGDAFRESVGRGAIETRKALSDMRGFTEGLKISSEEATDLSFKLTALAVDLSSFYNVEQEDASQRLRSGLIGNAEALDAFAARISEAQLKEFAEETGVLYNELTDTEKVMLRLELLQQKVNKAMGDAERTSGSFTNQMRALKGGLADAAAEFGVLVNEGVQETIEELGGPGKLIDLFETGAATAAELSVALIELAGEGVENLTAELERLGGARATILELRIAFLELKLGVAGIVGPLQEIGSLFAEYHPLIKAIRESNPFEDENDATREYKVKLAEIASLQEAITEQVQRQRDLMSGSAEDTGGITGQGAAQDASAAVGGLTLALMQAEAELAEFAEMNPAIVKLAELREELDALRESAQKTAGGSGLGGVGAGGAQAGVDGAAGLAAITTSLGVLKANADVAIQALGDVQEQIFSGGSGEGDAEAEAGWISGVQEAADSSRVLFDRWAESMVDGSASAADAFDEFGKRFLKQAAAIILRQQLLNALGISFDGGFGFTGGGLSGALGFGAKQADGGILQGAAMANGGVLPFNAYASGGIATGPQLALMGENPFYKGEAFVPLPDGRKIEVEGGGMGGGVTFQVQAIDAASFRDKILEERETYIGLIREAAIRDRAFRQTLGQAR